MNSRSKRPGWMRGVVVVLINGLLLLGILATEAIASNAESFSLADAVDAEKAGYTLLLILVLAILLETGLSTLFNWRVYLRYFEAKGLKVPIAVASAFFFVMQFDIDAVAEVLGAFTGKTYNHGTGGKILTAFIIAGGSSGVFTLFDKLGIRNPLERKETAEAIRRECRLKVKLIRNKVPNDQAVSILVDDKIIGVIDANKKDFGGFSGYIIDPGDRKIELKSWDAGGNEIVEPKQIAIAPGATVIETFRL